MVRPSFKTSNFYVKSSIFTVLSLLGAVFNYALYPALAHIVSTSSFGDFTVTLAISNQIIGIMMTFNIISMYLVKNFSEEKARFYAQTIQKVLIRFFLAATVITLALSPLIRQVLGIKSIFSLLILGLILLIAVPIMIWIGYLQGNKMLIAVGAFNCIAGVAKFIFVLLFAKLFGPVGGVFGALVGTLTGMIALKLAAGKVRLPDIRTIFHGFAEEERRFLHGTKYYFLQALFTVGGLSFLQNIDINYAKALFSADVAGIYSGVSILSNALYFGAFLLVWIILPEVDPKQPLINRRVLRTAYRLIFAIAALAVTAEYVLRGTITSLLLGNKFGGQGLVFIYATLFQISLVAATLFAYYLLIVRRSRVVALGGLLVVPCVILPLKFAHSPREMILILLSSVLAGSIIFAFVNLILNLRGNDGQTVTD